jgi:hypothetical protein
MDFMILIRLAGTGHMVGASYLIVILSLAGLVAATQVPIRYIGITILPIGLHYIIYAVSRCTTFSGSVVLSSCVNSFFTLDVHSSSTARL